MTNWKNTYNFFFFFHADFHTSNNVPWVDHNFEHVCVIGVGETIWCFNITYENTVSLRALSLVAFNDNLVFCCLFFVFRNVCCCYYCIPLKTNILLCCLGQVYGGWVCPFGSQGWGVNASFWDWRKCRRTVERYTLRNYLNLKCSFNF